MSAYYSSVCRIWEEIDHYEALLGLAPCFANAAKFHKFVEKSKSV